MKKSKIFFLGVMALVLSFGLVLAGCDNATNGGGNDNNNNGGKNPPTGSDRTPVPITVYVEKPASWTQLYAYVWDDSGDGNGKEYNGASPGTELTNINGAGFYSFQAAADYGYLNFRFSDGGGNSSVDIQGVDNTTYFKSADKTTADSKVIFQESTTSAFVNPRFYSSAKTSNTVTLNWDPVPGIDAYVLYYVVENLYGDEIWYFVEEFSSAETRFEDTNHGLYFFPETEYKWKLHAVTYKGNLNEREALFNADEESETYQYVGENVYAAFCDIVHDYGELTVTTAESPLPAPKNLQILSATGRSVELKWDSVPGAEYYVIYYAEDDEAAYWPWEYTANTVCVTEASETYEGDDWFEEGNWFMVAARQGNLQSADSDDVEIENISESLESNTRISLQYAASSARALSAPSDVRASANPTRTQTIDIEWSAVSGAKKYDVGLYKTSSATSPARSKTVDASMTRLSWESVPKGVYYIGVKPYGGGTNALKKTSFSLNAFPSDMGFKSKPTFTKSGGSSYVKMNIKLKGSWNGGLHDYVVKVVDDIGKTYYSGEKTGETFEITNLPKGLRYTITVNPRTRGNSTTYTPWQGSPFKYSSLLGK
jgi:predicted small secreted protein